MILILGVATVADEPPAPDSRAAQLRAMRAMVDGVTVAETARGRPCPIGMAGRAGLPIRRRGPACLRRDGLDLGPVGPAKSRVDVDEAQPPRAGRHWLTELTSLAPRGISATVEEIGTWQPSSAGVVMQTFPKAPLPAEDATKRLRQMKELVQPIKAHETSRPRRGRRPRAPSGTSYAYSLSRFTVTPTRRRA